MNRIQWIIKKLCHPPLLIRTFWTAEKAVEEKDWEKLIDLSKKLHQKGFCLDQTRFWLGCAYLHLNRNEEALNEFDKIEGKLDTIEEEVSRYWNHTLALYRAGRFEECYELLMQKIDPYWPTKTYNKARNFLAEQGFKAYRIKV